MIMSELRIVNGISVWNDFSDGSVSGVCYVSVQDDISDIIR